MNGKDEPCVESYALSLQRHLPIVFVTTSIISAATKRRPLFPGLWTIASNEPKLNEQKCLEN